MPDYVHGYDPLESGRLQDQATTLADLIHAGTHYAPGSRVLEAGCGVGAQTLTLARNSPDAAFTSIELSAESAAEAARRAAGLPNVTVQQADIFQLPYAPATFDHVFVCFVLEHLPEPAAALAALLVVLKPGGTMTVIEGDHGSTYFHPDDAAARAAVACQVELQRRAGGNALIGRQIYPLMAASGLQGIQVTPSMVYVDASKPSLVDGFIRKTFTAMVAGIRGAAVAAGLTDAAAFDAGIAGLLRTAEPGGVFCYTFFKGTGRKPGDPIPG